MKASRITGAACRIPGHNYLNLTDLTTSLFSRVCLRFLGCEGSGVVYCDTFFVLEVAETDFLARCSGLRTFCTAFLQG